MKYGRSMKQDSDIIDLVIVGAGPIGIEAAIYAQRLGFTVRVIEKGEGRASAIGDCGRATMYSPWQASFSPLGIELLSNNGGFSPPSDPLRWRDYLTGYLQPVAQLARLDIRFQTRVSAIGRAGISRTTLIANNRQAFPFKLLLCGPEGLETTLLAHRIIDASGVRDRPLWIGAGRMPAINEQSLRGRILPGACNLHDQVNGLVDRVWMVIGEGYEAAVAVHQIKDFLANHVAARLIFLDEQGRQPYLKNFKNDVFPKRVDFINQANAFLESGHPQVVLHTETGISRLDLEGDRLRVELDTPNGELYVLVDHLVGATGHAADESLWQELQIHQCYASGAPMATAAAMLADTIDHRLTPYALGCDSLKNPEPGFYVLGAKSYGRNPGFSLHIGLGQIVAAFRDMTEDRALDLYARAAQPAIRTHIAYLKEEASSPSSPQAEKLSDSEQKYKTIADNLQEVVFQTDLKQLITYLSPSWKTLTGKDPESFIGLQWQELLCSDTSNQGLGACNAFMSGSMAEYHEELGVEHIDGSHRWVEVRANLLLDLNRVAYGTIGSMVDITDRVNAQRALEESNRLLDSLAVTDQLTGLFNRRHLDNELEREIRRSVRDERPLTLAMIDIDHFKQYNDTYGHPSGDMVLKRIAQALRETCQRLTDLVCRYGGEEFVILLPGTDREAAARQLEGVRRDVINLHIEHSSSLVSNEVTISIGATTLDLHSMLRPESPEILLKRADDALYESKRQGRNRVTFCVHEMEAKRMMPVNSQ